MSKSKSFTVVIGWHTGAFGIGFHIDGYMFGLDIGFLYVGVEW